MFLTFIEGSMEVELMVTKRDDDRRPTTDDQQGEYRAICLWKMDWQSFAKTLKLNYEISYSLMIITRHPQMRITLGCPDDSLGMI